MSRDVIAAAWARAEQRNHSPLPDAWDATEVEIPNALSPSAGEQDE